MLPDEVCELINLDPAEIKNQRLSGRLRFAEEENGTRHYSIVDIINLKDSIAVSYTHLDVYKRQGLFYSLKTESVFLAISIR